MDGDPVNRNAKMKPPKSKELKTNLRQRQEKLWDSPLRNSDSPFVLGSSNVAYLNTLLGVGVGVRVGVRVRIRVRVRVRVR